MDMGAFSIIHWTILLGIGLLAAAGTGLLVWVIPGMINRPGASGSAPPSD